MPEVQDRALGPGKGEGMRHESMNPPAIVRAADDAELADLGRKIKVKLAEVRESKRQVLERSHEVGRLLATAKNRLLANGGKLLPWLRDAVGDVAESTVNRCILIADNWRTVKDCGSVAEAVRRIAGDLGQVDGEGNGQKVVPAEQGDKPARAKAEPFSEKVLAAALAKFIATMGKRMEKAKVGITDAKLAKSLGAWLRKALTTDDAWGAFVKALQGK